MNSTRQLTASEKSLLRKRYFRRWLAAGALMGLYALEIRVIGFRIPCPFRFVTGLRCPGCGITTMLLHILHGEFHAAFAANQVLFVLLPVLLLAAVVRIIWMPRFLMPESRFCRISTGLILAVLLGFGVLRNVWNL